MDVQVLIERSLVTLFGTKLWMHDLIQEMGREVVFQECREEPGKQSRLWLPKDIIHVLGQSKATSAVQSIYLECSTGDNVVHSIDNAFSNMDRLRLLKIWNLKCSGNIRYISNKLQYLEWHECPLDSFPSDFQPEKLVEVHMPFSRIIQLWRGTQGWSMLRHLDLSGSPYLISTPDFTEVPYLEELLFESCTGLVVVHPSLGFLKKLRHLDLQFCKSIESLPPLTALESLQILKLSFCSGLKKFPEIEGNMKSLLELHLDGTSIEELPPSIEHLTALTMLNLSNCGNLLHLPDTIGCLKSLKSLSLKGCSKIDEIPENLNDMKCLEKLFIGETSIRELSIIGGMKNLQYLSCRGCKCLVLESYKSLALLSSLIELDLSYCDLMDGAFLNGFSSLISLRVLELGGNCFVRLPESISQLSKLETLDLSGCRQLQLLPNKFPLSLDHVYAHNCTSLRDYPNQIKVLYSSESGVTMVNSLDSSAPRVSQSSTSFTFPRNAGESLQLLVTHKHTEGKQVDHVPLTNLNQVTNFAPDFYSANISDQIPEWFSTISTRNPISIPIAQNLADDNKWKGFAACAIFAVKGHTELSHIEPDPDFSNYSYQIILETDVLRLEQHVLKLDSGHFGSSSHLLVMFCISSLRFPQWGLNQSTVVRAIFETTNPSMVVQKCGIRLVYEKDDGWYSRISGWKDEPIWLNQVEFDSVRESDWLRQSLKREKFIPPFEEESTLVLRKNLESVLPRYLEALNSYSKIYKFNLRGSPGWFHKWFTHGTGRRSNLTRALIELPLKLHKNKKWMGFAIFASLVEEVGQTKKEDDYGVSFTLTTCDVSAPVCRELKHVRPLSEEHHQLLVAYIPRGQIPEELLIQTLTTAMEFDIRIDSPHVKRENSLESHNMLVVEEWMQLLRLQGAYFERRKERKKQLELHSHIPIYRNWEWSDPRCVYCVFERVEISKLKWFMSFINQGNSAEIQLPQNLFDDDNWLGFAVCFQLSPGQYPNISLGSSAPDSEDVVLSYCLDSDVAWKSLFDFKMNLSLKIREPSTCDMTWIHHIPRAKCRSNMWRQCKLARITIWLSNPCLAVHNCALRLLLKEDVEHLLETLTLAESP
ncbi:PREDICTED: uncharacterized protein LOC101295301 [Fragaria vesca subsp. vesca]